MVYFDVTIPPFIVGLCLNSKILQHIVYIVILNQFFLFLRIKVMNIMLDKGKLKLKRYALVHRRIDIS